jgi:Lar family restriction alleviation protein
MACGSCKHKDQDGGEFPCSGCNHGRWWEPMENKILPCPFCGGKANIHHSHAWYSVGCLTERCCGTAHALTHKTEESAIDAWNTRKTISHAA